MLEPEQLSRTQDISSACQPSRLGCAVAACIEGIAWRLPLAKSFKKLIGEESTIRNHIITDPRDVFCLLRMSLASGSVV